MSENNSPSQPDNLNNKHVPVEPITQQNMSVFQTALTATRASLSRNMRSIDSATLLSKRSFSVGGGRVAESATDIEDSGRVRMVTCKRSKVQDSLLHQFRRRRGLSVTDLTSTEWCEKQMEFVLRLSKRRTTKAMEAGSARHAILEDEVIKRVNVPVETAEDKWALKILNFIVGANQLLSEGLTRELQIVGFLEGVWMVGIIDELRMPETEANRDPVLVDTKTRSRNSLPAKPQKRNGRLQLMCYKHIWDNIVTNQFPSEKFFTFFSLNRHHILSEEVRKCTTNAGLPSQTLDDVVRHYRNTCSMLPPASGQLILRYELQKDNSVIAEDQFPYDSEWLKDQMQKCLEFWQGEREASYTPEDERWKCRYCQFASVCPTGISYEDNGSSPKRANQDSVPSTSTDPADSTPTRSTTLLNSKIVDT